jgi:phosphinothricin acetyltransferase
VGFKQVGIVKDCGWKFGAWRYIVIMQKTLGLGSSEPSTEPSTP